MSELKKSNPFWITFCQIFYICLISNTMKIDFGVGFVSLTMVIKSTNDYSG